MVGDSFHHQDHEGRQDHQEIPNSLELLATQIVDCGLKVHRQLGPGLLESVYEACLARELELRSLPVSRQVAVPVEYEGIRLETGYRLDLVVASSIIIEIKAVESLSRLHEAQLLTYLRLSGLRLGFLMNFNVLLFKNGVRRRVL